MAKTKVGTFRMMEILLTKQKGTLDGKEVRKLLIKAPIAFAISCAMAFLTDMIPMDDMISAALIMAPMMVSMSSLLEAFNRASSAARMQQLRSI